MGSSDGIPINLILIVYLINMLKYVNYDIVFQELPNETTLAINISNCPCRCKGCHSSYLAEDIGKPLIFREIEKLIKENEGITAICFMGGDSEPKLINHYAKLIRESTIDETVDSFTVNKDVELPKGIKIPAGSVVKSTRKVPNPIRIGWYSGRQELSKDIDIKNFNYIKLGPYIEELGGLKNPNTNQRLYEVQMSREIDENGDPVYGLMDITNVFWK